MIEPKGKDFIVKKPGYPLGVITDGDPLDRPDGSLAIAENIDFDYETGTAQTRNGTVDSDLLDGLTIPSGYNIMPGGLKVFSFNDPVDRIVVLCFVQNIDKDVRIYVNTWFNPPAPNTDPVGSNNDYENHIAPLPVGWQDSWIELTEYEAIVDFAKLSAKTFEVDGSALSYQYNDAYRGWFAWNATKWNSGTTNQIKNESFVCIENFDGSNLFTIQNRESSDLSSWSTSDEVFLLRYPIIVHKANSTSLGDIDLRLNFTPTSNNWLIKTNISIECLIGQKGNLWFGFLNRDVTERDNASVSFFVNRHKYYGWWLDYAHYPVEPLITNLVSGTTKYLDPILGVKFRTEEQALSGSQTKMLGLSFKVDFRQYIGVYKGTNLAVAVDRAQQIFTTNYHQYSRRITGCRRYGLNATYANDDPIGYEDTADVPQYNTTSAEYIYNPFYSFYTAISTIIIGESPTYPKDNISLESRIGYLLQESNVVSSTIGVFAQGRLFVNNLNQADEIRYSLFQREDILPLQNKRNIDSTDRDKNIAINLLGVNPVIFKNNSIHIINIEGESEVGWRLVEARSRVGCPYPNSVVNTNYGIVFANDQSIWLLTDSGEPIDLLDKMRKTEWLALPNKDTFFVEWQPERHAIWVYIGSNDFWVCQLRPEQGKRGWRNYSFPFTPIDIITGDDGEFYLIGADYAYRVLSDSEMTEGTDADGSVISYRVKENLSTLGRYVPFHHIETVLSLTAINKDDIIPNGNIATINVDVLREVEQIMQSKVFQWNVSSTSPESFVIKNDKANRQRAIGLDITGDLTWHKRIKFNEVNSRCKPVVTQVKAGYREA